MRNPIVKISVPSTPPVVTVPVPVPPVIKLAGGVRGKDGAPGVGVPTGGTTRQALVKASDADYDTEWQDIRKTETEWAIGALAAGLAGMSAFRDGSLTIGLASDSTGNDINDWPTLWLRLFAAQNPLIRVDRRVWNATNQTLGPVLEMQAGEGGTPGNDGTVMSDNFNRTGDIIGSTSSGGQTWLGQPLTGSLWTADGAKALPPSSEHGSIAVDVGAKTATVTNDISLTTLATGALRQIRAWAGGTTPWGSTSVWAGLSVNATGIPSLSLYKTINGVSTALATASWDLGIGAGSTTPILCTLELTVSGASVKATLTAPAKVTTLTGELTPGDISGLGTYAGLYGGGPDVFAVDNIHISGPATPPVPAPGIRLINGAVAGSQLSYQATRLAQMYPEPLDAMIISTGHNNTNQPATSFRTEVEDFISLVEATHPGVKILLSSQNPQYPPATNPTAHRTRQAVMRALAAERKYDYIPAFERFSSLPDGGRSLVEPDGIHPTTPPAPYSPTPGYGATYWASLWQESIDRA